MAINLKLKSKNKQMHLTELVTSSNDTKILDTPNKKLYSSVPLLVLFLIISVFAVLIYKPVISQTASYSKALNTYLKSDDFIYTLADVTTYLKHNEMLSGNSFKRNYSSLDNLKYYMIDTTSNKSISNISNLSDQILKDYMADSRFYLHISFDKNGNMKVHEISDRLFSFNTLSQAFNRYQVIHNAYHFNLDIIYIVPAELTDSHDFITRGTEKLIELQYIIIFIIIALLGILIVGAMAVCIPYTYQRQLKVLHFINKLFFELKVFALLGFMTISIHLSERILSYYSLSQLINIIHTRHPNFYIISTSMLFLIYLLTYLTVTYIKSICYEGFKNRFLKDILCIRILYYLLKKIRCLFIKLISIDFSQNHLKQLALILLVNFFILFLIGISWPFGLSLAIAYSFILYHLLSKILSNIKILAESSNVLASGSFNFNLSENLGILNPIAVNLNNIKEGFKVAVEQETRSQNMKSELISSVSHDLKTPLTSILAYIDLLKNENPEADNWPKYIHILEQKSQRLKVLIEDLFEISRAVSGNIELHPEPIDIISLLKQALGELEEKIQTSGLQLRTKWPDYKISCYLDGQKTYRIFENLISNISKYALPHSRVYIDLLDESQNILIILKNISAYEMNFDADEITDRFTRGDRARHTEGSGLGLAIAKSLTELQDGSLIVYVDGDLFKVTVSFPKINCIELKS